MHYSNLEGVRSRLCCCAESDPEKTCSGLRAEFPTSVELRTQKFSGSNNVACGLSFFRAGAVCV